MFILLVSNVILAVIIRDLKKQRDVYYSNYKNCLLALKEHDKELAKYLESRDEKKRTLY